MYGNSALPGYKATEPNRKAGSMWRGYTEATWFKVVDVGGSGEEATEIPQGTLMIETDGVYAPMTSSDIISTVASLPGKRVVIVADETAVTGTTQTVDEVSQAVPSRVLVGIRGKVDMKRVLLEGTPFTELESGKEDLERQLDAWGFQLVEVVEG